MDPRDHNDNRDHGHEAHDHGPGHRTHRFHPSQLDRLTSAERHAELPPVSALNAAGVIGGMTVVDLGCGLGFFAIPGHYPGCRHCRFDGIRLRSRCAGRSG